MYRHVGVVLFLCSLANQVAELHGQPRIVGGSATTIRQHPHTVSIRSNDNHICGGVILSATRILTAAHCVDGRTPSTMSIRAGSDFRSSGGTIAAVSGYRKHPRFGRRPLSFDLAIIYLSQALPIGNTIRPISLYNQQVRAGQRVVATGWGTRNEGGSLSEQIRSTQFQTINRRVCRRIFGQGVGRGMFCAGTMTGARDTCQGDSGGPLVLNGQLAGITSNGNGCGRRGSPGLYSAVPLNRRWINRFI